MVLVAARPSAAGLGVRVQALGDIGRQLWPECASWRLVLLLLLDARARAVCVCIAADRDQRLNPARRRGRGSGLVPPQPGSLVSIVSTSERLDQLVDDRRPRVASRASVEHAREAVTSPRGR
jgi:hypothetical protein